jgi:hypothetical protein
VTVAANVPDETQLEPVSARTSTWPDVIVR